MLSTGSNVPISNQFEIRYRKTENGKPLPVEKLEFLKDLSGSLLYIIATLPAGYQAKLFHQSTYLGMLIFKDSLIGLPFQ